MKNLEDFFQFKWVVNKPRVFTVSNRQTFDEISGEKTESWVVGRSQGGNIFLLDKENFEKESNHIYRENYYVALLKHELCHLFYWTVCRGYTKPRWLNEGICTFTSGQLELKKRPDKIDEFLDFYDVITKGEKMVYDECGFVVEWLINKHGKEKLLELIKRSKDYQSEEKFKELFEEIYKFKLSYENFLVE